GWCGRFELRTAEANAHALGVLEQTRERARRIALTQRAQLPQIRQQLAEHLECDVMPIGKFEQAIDGFQVLNAATKWIHDHTKTRRKNKLKVANGNERLSPLLFRSCHEPTTRDGQRGRRNWQLPMNGAVRQSLTPRSMSEIVSRA